MPSPHLSQPSSSPVFSFAAARRVLRRLLQTWQAGRQARQERRRQREELALMSAPELSDLGLSRAQIQFDLSEWKSSAD
ncbi:DUF1127 domain-containing protein [Paucibacter sp. KBW04]|uniref:DUF1127 domain-containing protein n=1 Tax=Paucibacter sp. KBW04 TaxID=2153361 RepID=UPI0018CC0481|nr:DUF1127 domain-containing protein [Paucibacter sp. KBW04]